MLKERILLVADGRSPIAKNWISMLQGLGYAVHLASTFPCGKIAGVESQETIPAGFSSLAGGQVNGRTSGHKPLNKQLIAAFRPAFLYARALLAPMMLGPGQEKLLAYVNNVQPDIVHALRIPFEGMLAAVLPTEIPLVVSIWGNDLTMHARTTRAMNLRTKETLLRANALMADASRDIEMAKRMGLHKKAPTCVVPGSGGLDMDLIAQTGKADKTIRARYSLPEGVPMVVNPRGFRPGSVHQETFFACIPLVLERKPDVHFVCPGMAGQRKAEKWVERYGISSHVSLLPFLEQHELWEIYKQSSLYVSLSSHDGTPNSFLEALACGCFPIVGDILSLREWITDGENGLLVDPRRKKEAVRAICEGLSNTKLRQTAAGLNLRMVSARADRAVVSRTVDAFYRQLQRK